MVLHGVDLGRLGVASTASGLHLDLHSYAKIASPEEGFDFDQDVLTIAAKTWFRRGNDFRLSIRLSFDGSSPDCSLESLVEAICQSFGREEHWNQLLLTPISVESSNALDVASIVASLRHRDDVETGRRMHRLEDGVPYYDRTPPPGIQTLCLDEFCLEMRLSRTKPRKRRKLESSLSECVQPASSDQQGCEEQSQGIRMSTAKSRHCDTEGRFSPPLSSDGKSGISSRRSKTSPAPDCMPSDDTDVLFGLRNQKFRVQGRECPISNASRKRSYSTGDLDATPIPSDDCGGLLDLFHAGLSLAISSNPKRLLKQYRVISNESFQHLADVFPSLWLPGYLHSVSSRAVFLPTISHALSTVSSECIQSPTLRSKLCELSRREVRPSDVIPSENDAMGEDSPARAQKSIASRLWLATQGRLLDKNAARRLEAFTCSLGDMYDGDPDILADLRLASPCSLNEDLDDVDSDSDDSILAEDALTPGSGTDGPMEQAWNELAATEYGMILDGAVEHVADEKRGIHVDTLPGDEILSLCDSADSLVLDGEMEPVSQWPDAYPMPSEKMMDKSLFDPCSDGEGGMEEMLPI